ncbi:uncharacterized protein EAE97_010893 [Botrytis byssoidea]|uniref:Uncharacterized protein n=1 Tax=Botrytis byssoidea TaxID=139641 RepID=A0A9P5HXP7_9HELO|nr:uncharacterized protein EAE97_010893 [Botrytis byssoidea]KAF7923455.1 hypothetical protein EAE97_010893 [Botrytis byssoidea]
MSTEIPLTANHTQQPFKLLELPPELLTLLESDVPPTLLLTSSPQPPHHAHLLVSPSPSSASTSTTPSTTTKKTYLLRQKNTSNPLMLLSPSTYSSSSSSTSTPQPQPSITRIGSISDTIELIEKEEEIIDGQEKHREKEPEVSKKTTTGKVNKWHEKFAKSRGSGTNSKG